MKLAVKAATGIDSEETIECDVHWRMTPAHLMKLVTKDPKLLVFCEEWLGLQYSDKVSI